MPGPEGGISSPLGDQEGIGRDVECGVMVESSPPSTFVMAEAEFLLQILIVALDAPPQLGGRHQVGNPRCAGQRRQPVFRRLGLAVRLLDQEPFLGMGLGEPIVAMSRSNANCGVCIRRGPRADGDVLPENPASLNWNFPALRDIVQAGRSGLAISSALPC